MWPVWYVQSAGRFQTNQTSLEAEEKETIIIVWEPRIQSRILQPMVEQNVERGTEGGGGREEGEGGQHELLETEEAADE